MQNTFSQSGNDSKWFLKKSFFKIGKWQSRPPRDPPPFMANAILNFHFDFLNPSLSQIASLSKNWLYNIGQIWAQKLNSKLQSYDQTWALNTWPKFSFKIVDLTSALESWPKFCIKILTKLPLQNLDQISASKSWPKTYFKVRTNVSASMFVTKIKVQNPYQTSARKSWPNLCQHVPQHQ